MTEQLHSIEDEFQRNNITRCERCGGTFALSFAHRVKRRFITTDEELRTVALLCQQCHAWAEYGDRDNPGTHERMYDIISGLIERRQLYGNTQESGC